MGSLFCAERIQTGISYRQNTQYSQGTGKLCKYQAEPLQSLSPRWYTESIPNTPACPFFSMPWLQHLSQARLCYCSQWFFVNSVMMASSTEPAIAYSSFGPDYHLVKKKIIMPKSSDPTYMDFFGIEENRTLRMSILNDKEHQISTRKCENTGEELASHSDYFLNDNCGSSSHLDVLTSIFCYFTKLIFIMAQNKQTELSSVRLLWQGQWSKLNSPTIVKAENIQWREFGYCKFYDPFMYDGFTLETYDRTDLVISA